MDLIVQNGNLSYSKIPSDLKERDFRQEKHGTRKVIIDENVVEDIKHAVAREHEDSVELFPAIPLIAEMYDKGEIYLNHDVLDELRSKSYGENAMLNDEALGEVEEFFREYTTDLALDEWEDQLEEEGDDLYSWIADYQDSVLLTYDRDFFREEGAMTPGRYLDGWRNST